jgi:hypothetical protein
VGINGQPSIRQLELDHGTSWKYWDKNNEQLVFDPDKDPKGRILRLSTDPVGFKKSPSKTRKQWHNSWYRFRLVIDRLNLYAQVLMGPEMNMSEEDAGRTACLILQREMAKSEKRNLKDFSETNLRKHQTEALKALQGGELQEQLKEVMNAMENITTTS